ncbi:MAG: ATP-binding protein [bacterium]
MDREEYILSNLLGGDDDPEVRSILWARRNPNMAKAVPQMLRGLARRRGINPDNPPPVGLPVRLSPSMYPLGSAMSGNHVGPRVGLADDDLYGHIGVFGKAGEGKSSLIKLLLTRFAGRQNAQFIVLDMHGEYSDLVTAMPAGKVILVDPDQIGLNPFEVPKLADGRLCMSPEKWLGLVRELLRLMWLNEPSLNLFAEVLLRLYRQRGVLNGGRSYPRISDVLGVLDTMDPKRGSDRAYARGKLLDRLGSMRAMLPGLDVHCSRNLHKLFWEHSVVLNMSQTSDVALPVLFNSLMNALTMAFRATPGEPVRHMIVLEEAHLLLGGQVNRRTADLRENRGVAVLRFLRKAGITAVVANQLVSDLDPAVLGNIGTVFCFRLTQRRCIAQAASMLGLKQWAQRELALLPRGEVIARLSRYAHPIHLKVDDAGDLARHAGDEQAAREASRRILDEIPYVVSQPPSMGTLWDDDASGDAVTSRGRVGEAAAPAATPQASGAVGSPASAATGTRGEGGTSQAGKPACKACESLGLALDRKQHRVLTDICEHPASMIQERCDRLHMPRETESTERRALMTQGLIELAGSLGNKRLLFRPTDKGREWAEAHGLKLPKYHASVLHEYIRRKAEQRLAEAAPGTKFVQHGAGEPAGVRPDSVAQLPGKEGHRVVIQAVVAHNPKGEAANLLKLCERRDGAGWVDLVLSVASKRSVQHRVEEAVKELNAGQLPANLVFVDAESLMDPACDLTWVLERDV